MRRRAIAGMLAALLAFLPALSTETAAQDSLVVVFAAASLKNALDAVNKRWQSETGKRATVSYAASSALARQIEHGAPAQLFISADLDWMDYLAGKGLIKAESRVNLLGNRLVLIAPRSAGQPIEIGKGFDLAGRLGSGRLAIANVDAVPAGRYGKAALQKLEAWQPVADKLAQAENVRAALLLVSRGEAPLGIVYQTDAAADANVAIVGLFPEDSHPAIVYPAALTSTAADPDAAALLAFMRSPAAKLIFEAQGFTVLGTGRS